LKNKIASIRKTETYSSVVWWWKPTPLIFLLTILVPIVLRIPKVAPAGIPANYPPKKDSLYS